VKRTFLFWLFLSSDSGEKIDFPMKISFYGHRFAILSHLSGRRLSILCVERLPQTAMKLKKAVLGSFVFFHFGVFSSQFLKINYG
jgi:hypothetical protein